MFDKMKQLMELKKQADQLKRELDQLSVDVEEISGIKLTVNGSQNFQSVDVSEEYLQSADKAKFDKDLLRSLNAAVRKSQEAAASKMKGMPGLNLPGM